MSKFLGAAYYKVEFDFSGTDKHNEGPSVRVILAPPVTHVVDEKLCLAQVIPHSDSLWWWKGRDAAKYSSYNFDRVQQMMNVMNSGIYFRQPGWPVCIS
ncbi:hypothetical protein [Endozoicomonas sp. YOMI1]|uniref:hypothetical protein n=1 Tax=Endozoicomonas sp. YOMI1 TaxID=2828739 RepID=UPI002147AEE3|nr:hypothetical protein [Endozoicomonas sp. YOMI1]